MNAAEILASEGYEDVIIFENPDYSTALIGVDTNNRAVYSYEKMVEDLVKCEGYSEQDAIDWIEYNTIRSLPYMGS